MCALRSLFPQLLTIYWFGLTLTRLKIAGSTPNRHHVRFIGVMLSYVKLYGSSNRAVQNVPGKQEPLHAEPDKMGP